MKFPTYIDWMRIVSYAVVAIMLIGFFAVTQCRGDEYAASESGIWQLAWRDGRPEWLKISKEGDRVIVHRIGAPLPPLPPDDDDQPDPPPSGITERVRAAVLATNDSTNAGYLRDLYLIGVTMLDADASALQIVTILKIGESRILDTDAERRLWGAYLTLTASVYGNRPAVLPQDIRDVYAGIDAATKGPSRIYYLRKKTP